MSLHAFLAGFLASATFKGGAGGPFPWPPTKQYGMSMEKSTVTQALLENIPAPGMFNILKILHSLVATHVHMSSTDNANIMV